MTPAEWLFSARLHVWAYVTLVLIAVMSGWFGWDTPDGWENLWLPLAAGMELVLYRCALRREAPRG